MALRLLTLFLKDSNSEALQQKNFTSAKVQSNCNSVKIYTLLSQKLSQSFIVLDYNKMPLCSYELQVLSTVQQTTILLEKHLLTIA